ncbi:hypothetical protein SF83666_a43950 (plasmid) [Sinorhizobium fredii CCBAU 83666]|nr:hypothetical protein SF83666_a43950 [Sinorhizobium fredii CCBAU 83666]
MPATRIQRQLQAACTRKASKAVPSRWSGAVGCRFSRFLSRLDQKESARIKKQACVAEPTIVPSNCRKRCLSGARSPLPPIRYKPRVLGRIFSEALPALSVRRPIKFA